MEDGAEHTERMQEPSSGGSQDGVPAMLPGRMRFRHRTHSRPRRSRYFISIEDIQGTLGGAEPSICMRKDDSAPQLLFSGGHAVDFSEMFADKSAADLSRSFSIAPIVDYDTSAAEQPAPATAQSATVAKKRIVNFNPVAFKNKLLYENSGLDTPLRATWRSIRDSKIDTLRSFWNVFRKKIIHVLMRNDRLLTHSDALLLYGALRKYFEIKDYEYWFKAEAV
ncbi:hypothetical protein PAPHI01_1990 [Pancytospora philotis]|nr:hypothetical protein PAPHI01_1990 [Pancytospora philotis]